MGIFAWIRAQARADGIHPDVSSNGIGRFARAQNVIVEFFLPEKAIRIFPERQGACVFHVFDEGEQIRSGFQAGDKAVQVIGHDAVGMDPEAMLEGMFLYDFDQAGGAGGVCEYGTTFRAAERDEI